MGALEQIPNEGTIFIYGMGEFGKFLWRHLSESMPNRHIVAAQTYKSENILSINDLTEAFLPRDVVLIASESYRNISVSLQIRGIPHKRIYNALPWYQDATSIIESKKEQEETFREKYIPTFDISSSIDPEKHFIAVLGDSTVYRFPSHEITKIPNLYNIGIPRLTTDMLSSYVDLVIAKNVGAVALSIGIVDLTTFVMIDPEIVLDGIKQAANRFGNAGIPCAIHTIVRPNHGLSAELRNLRISAADYAVWVNRGLRGEWLGKEASIIDLDAQFCDDQGLRPEYCSYDYVHINAAGYLRWGKLLRDWYDTLPSHVKNAG